MQIEPNVEASGSPAPQGRPRVPGHVRARRRTVRRLLTGAGVLALVAALQWAISVGEPKVAPPTGVDEISLPLSSIENTEFVDGVDHPWLPLTAHAGNRERAQWEYTSGLGEGGSTVGATLEVLDEREQVLGVPVTALQWTLRGEPSSTLLLAQDRRGHVWLLGVRAGRLKESWSVADGRPAGLLLPAEPRRGDGYPVAYDRAAQVRASASVQELLPDASGERRVQTPAGEFDDLVRVQWSTASRAADEFPVRVTLTLAKGTGPVVVDPSTSRPLRLLSSGS